MPEKDLRYITIIKFIGGLFKELWEQCWKTRFRWLEGKPKLKQDTLAVY